MLQTALFAFGASIPLVIGGAIGASWQPPKKLLAVALAFAAGALISALAFELFLVSYEDGGLARAGLGLLVGAAVFVTIDTALDKWASGSSVGLALLAGVTLDGIPENTALGVSLAGSGGSIALLAAIFASNLPESLGGAAKMRENGRSRKFAIGIWLTAAIILALAVVVGRYLFRGSSPEQLAFPLAFASGAVLASVIDTLAPEAFDEGGPLIAFASAAGFLFSFALGH